MKTLIQGLKEQDKKQFDELQSLCTDTGFFKFQNLIIKGNSVTVIKKYLHQNTSVKFRIWLIDSGYVITEL